MIEVPAATPVVRILEDFPIRIKAGINALDVLIRGLIPCDEVKMVDVETHQRNEHEGAVYDEDHSDDHGHVVIRSVFKPGGGSNRFAVSICHAVPYEQRCQHDDERV
eukprot:CAMPEP_0185798784 /NCGR_PEP_ID=MMETSP1174-20130828/162332_1 /TAXON_ID=35687 /ORGANISM="Dictyocha speculum, Strain CCMP1381" /LENGTH=106 /DNA_ID=CAMNT_0028494299 /DNA_START=458 /DNA_END=778 /DNA_ORIENTATION=-